MPVPPAAYGGTEAVLDALARGLQAAGHHVLLICHPESSCPVPKASVIPVEDTVRMGRAAIELENVVGAYELAKAADVVHDNTMQFEGNGRARLRPDGDPAGLRCPQVVA